MFGEKPILGITNGSIDDKKRIFVPRMYGASPGDEVAVCQQNPDTVDLYPTTALYDRIRYLDEIKSSTDSKEIYMRAEKLQQSLFAAILYTSKLDCQHRVLLRGVSDSFYSGRKGICFLGENDHLKLFSSRDKLDDYAKPYIYVKKESVFND